MRLRGYDYQSAGAYFITLCTQYWRPLFGEVAAGAMVLNDYGLIVQDEWLRTPLVRPQTALDAFVVMPNHFHGILLLADRDPKASSPPAKFGRPLPDSLASVVGQFKAVVAKRINRLRPSPSAGVWQRNYYERILRDERELKLARHYIEDNPARWGEDRYSLPTTPQHFA